MRHHKKRTVNLAQVPTRELDCNSSCHMAHMRSQLDPILLNSCPISRRLAIRTPLAKHIQRYVISKYSKSNQQPPVHRYKLTLNTADAPVAVAVYGSDVGLESTQAILSLLETNAILLLFSPSLTFLQVLKSAIGTVIDLPEVKLKDNVPLIVYKFILDYYPKVHANFTITRMRGIDRFHIVPGFAISKSEQQSTESRQFSFLELSVKLVEKCTAHASDPIVLHQLANEDSLTPPWGTMWWKRQVQLKLSEVLH